jgi:hypothetical protein
MSKSPLQINNEKIVKCACGLTMRQNNWRDHWKGCRIGSSVPVTNNDIINLTNSELRQKEADDQHQIWLNNYRENLLSKKIDVFGRKIS